MHDIVIINILPELRARKKLTQDALANAVWVTRQTIISIEKGAYTPSLPLALALSKYFEIPVESIFTIS